MKIPARRLSAFSSALFACLLLGAAAQEPAAPPAEAAPDAAAEGPAPESSPPAAEDAADDAPEVPAPVDVGVQELMVEVADSHGDTPRDLGAGDLEVLAGGAEQPVLEVAVPARGASPSPAGGPWHLTLYFDSLLAADRSIGRAGRVLEEQAGALAALGWVEVVVADPDPRLLLPATRDPQQISAALGRVFLLEGGQDRLVAERRAALAAILDEAAGEDRQAAVARAIAAETELVRGRQDALLGWLADRGQSAAGPRALLLITDGFDLDPAAALRDRLAVAKEAGSALPAPGAPALLAPTQDLARALAATGWVTLPLVLQLGGSDASRWGTAFNEGPRGEPPGPRQGHPAAAQVGGGEGRGPGRGREGGAGGAAAHRSRSAGGGGGARHRHRRRGGHRPAEARRRPDPPRRARAGALRRLVAAGSGRRAGAAVGARRAARTSPSARRSGPPIRRRRRWRRCGRAGCSKASRARATWR